MIIVEKIRTLKVFWYSKYRSRLVLYQGGYMILLGLLFPVFLHSLESTSWKDVVVNTASVINFPQKYLRNLEITVANSLSSEELDYLSEQTSYTIDTITAVSKSFLDESYTYISLEEADLVVTEHFSQLLADLNTASIKRKAIEAVRVQDIVDDLFDHYWYPDELLDFHNNYDEETVNSYAFSYEGASQLVNKSVVLYMSSIIFSSYRKEDHAEQKRMAEEIAAARARRPIQSTELFAAGDGRVLLSRDSISSIRLSDNRDPFNGTHPMRVKRIIHLVPFFQERKLRVSKKCDNFTLDDIEEQDVLDALTAEPFYLSYKDIKPLEDYCLEKGLVSAKKLLDARRSAKKSRKLYNMVDWLAFVKK